jgi:excinuclease ABC subunit C
MNPKPSWYPQASEIPTGPGVYRFLNAEKTVIYVGKAKNLKARLSTYFQSPGSLHERTRRMVGQACFVDWTLVPTERQALQLEYLWIKEFSPSFNVRFRDDKSYPYLVLTLLDDVPRVFLARKKGIKGAKYFGPFPSAWALRETLSTLVKAFPVRSCTKTVYEKAKRSHRPCLLGDIGKCSAPCVGRIGFEAHKALALSLSQFMAGADSQVLDQLRVEMAEAAQALDFERAARFRDRIDAINTILMKNTMVLDEALDADIFGLATDALSGAAHVFRVRGGRIRSAKGFIVDRPEESGEGELVEMILRDGFEDHPPAATVVVPVLPPNHLLWQKQLSDLRAESGEKGVVVLKVPKRGELRTLQQTVTLNAKHTLGAYLSTRTTDPTTRSRALSEIAAVLALPEAPLRIECFDVSHLSGDSAVASMVVFEDGLAKRSDYRKYALDSPRDDTEAIVEVITRRVGRLVDSQDPDSQLGKGFRYPPGLMVIDGGLPQVNAAKRAQDALGVSIPLCGLAKKLEEVWVPGASYPIILPRNSEGLFLLQRMRDEAHRVAITYQRQTRSKTLHTELWEIPGVGPELAKKLLKTFGSLARVRRASVQELQAVPGVGLGLATKIHTHFS